MPWMDSIKWSAQTTEGGTTDGKQPGVVDCGYLPYALDLPYPTQTGDNSAANEDLGWEISGT